MEIGRGTQKGASDWSTGVACYNYSKGTLSNTIELIAEDLTFVFGMVLWEFRRVCDLAF